MAEYISKEDVLQKIESEAMWTRSFSILYEHIEDMQAADVAPVRHGLMKKVNSVLGVNIYKCTVCENKFSVMMDSDCNPVDYCPKCGAKMDGGDDE